MYCFTFIPAHGHPKYRKIKISFYEKNAENKNNFIVAEKKSWTEINKFGIWIEIFRTPAMTCQHEIFIFSTLVSNSIFDPMALVLIF